MWLVLDLSISMFRGSILTPVNLKCQYSQALQLHLKYFHVCNVLCTHPVWMTRCLAPCNLLCKASSHKTFWMVYTLRGETYMLELNRDYLILLPSKYLPYQHTNKISHKNIQCNFHVWYDMVSSSSRFDLHRVLPAWSPSCLRFRLQEIGRASCRERV